MCAKMGDMKPATRKIKAMKRIAFTLVLSLWPLADWTEPAFSQSCPVPGVGSAVPVVPVIGPLTVPVPTPTDCTSQSPVNGVCGSTIGSCSAGTPTAVSNGAWACVGLNGGTTAICSSPPPPTMITMGETSCNLTGTDGGNGGFLLVQAATLAQAGTLQSLSFCVTNPAGQLRLGVYTLDNQIVVQTGTFTPIAGRNTQLVGNVPIPAGTYWLAYEPSSSDLTFPVDQSSGQAKWAAMPTFGAMPVTFPTVDCCAGIHWGLSATLNVP